MATQAEEAVVNSDNGVSVEDLGDKTAVKFDYDRDLVGVINKVEGAAFDNESKSWLVPASSKEQLDKAIKDLRYKNAAINKDREGIESLAQATAIERMREYGTGDGIKPKLSDYHELGDSNSGEIINVNGHFAAQLTGFGKENGAAFVSIHRLADLKEPVYKGDNVRIKYNQNSIGEVIDRSKVKTMDDLRQDFNKSLGQKIDGVAVYLENDKYLVSFDYNTEMQHRLQRVSGAEFNTDDKVWEVPAGAADFVIRAVSDMRKEYVADMKERNEMDMLADQKVDGAKVRDAFTKDGTSHYGKIVGGNERYVLQHGGQNEFKLHRRGALDQSVENGQSHKITYNKGRGVVEDRALGKGKSAGLER